MKDFSYQELLPINTIEKVDVLIEKLLNSADFKVNRSLFETNVMMDIKRMKIQIYFKNKIKEISNEPQVERNQDRNVNKNSGSDNVDNFQKITQEKNIIYEKDKNNSNIKFKNSRKNKKIINKKSKAIQEDLTPKIDSNYHRQDTVKSVSPKNIVGKTIYEISLNLKIPSKELEKLTNKKYYEKLDYRDYNLLKKPLNNLIEKLGLSILNKTVELDPNESILRPKYFPSKGKKGNYGKLIYIPTRR